MSENKKWIYFFNTVILLILLFFIFYDSFISIFYLSSIFVLIIAVFLILFSKNLGRDLLLFILILFPLLDIQKEIIPHFFLGLVDVVMIPLVFYSWFKWLDSGNRGLHLVYKLYFLFIAAYIISGFFSNEHFNISLRYIIYLIYGITFISTFINKIINTSELLKLLNCIVIASLLPIFIAVLEYIIKRDITPFFTFGASSIGVLRLSATMAPNSFGYYLAFIIPLIFIQYELKRNKYLFLLIFIYLLFIYLSGSRAAFLFAVINIVGYLFYKVYKSESQYKKHYYIASTIIFFILIYIGYLLIIMRRMGDVSSNADFSSLMRIFLWEAAYKMFLSQPITGVGCGSFILYHEKYLNPVAQKLLYMGGHPHAHNIFLHILAEMGIIGLIGTIIFITILLVKLFKMAKRSNSKEGKVISSILIIMSFGFLLSQQFDFLMAATSHGREILLTYLLLAIIHFQILSDKREILSKGQ